ncbi:hypothetical protein ACVW00_003587 [Marmoricola sp. URHA0025 HA25]
MQEDEFRALASRVDRSRRWPETPERGALNFITRQSTSQALHAAISGEVISCADRAAAHSAITQDEPRPLKTRLDRSAEWLAVNETLTLEQHGPNAMTHLDALGHFYYQGSGFGGAGEDAVTDSGVTMNDVVAAAGGIVGRGFLLDLPRLLGLPYLPLAQTVTLAELETWLGRAGSPRSGDILFVRTGRPVAPLPPRGQLPEVGGLALECATWIFDSEFSLVISDAGMDSPKPVVDNVATPWHVLTLTRMGVPLVDFADLEQIAAACDREARWTFLAVVAVLPISGATASPVNPLAIM